MGASTAPFHQYPGKSRISNRGVISPTNVGLIFLKKSKSIKQVLGAPRRHAHKIKTSQIEMSVKRLNKN